MHYKITGGPEPSSEPCECPIGQDHLVAAVDAAELTDVAAEPEDRITGLAR